MSEATTYDAMTAKQLAALIDQNELDHRKKQKGLRALLRVKVDAEPRVVIVHTQESGKPPETITESAE